MEASITMVAIYKVTSCAPLWQLQVKEDLFRGNITRHRFRLFLARVQEEKDDACNIPGTLEELEEKAGVRLVNVSPCHCVFHAAGDLANFVRLLGKWFRYQKGWGEIHIYTHTDVEVEPFKDLDDQWISHPPAQALPVSFYGTTAAELSSNEGDTQKKRARDDSLCRICASCDINAVLIPCGQVLCGEMRKYANMAQSSSESAVCDVASISIAPESQ